MYLTNPLDALGVVQSGESYNADTTSSTGSEHQMNIYHSNISPSANSAFDTPGYVQAIQ